MAERRYWSRMVIARRRVHRRARRALAKRMRGVPLKRIRRGIAAGHGHDGGYGARWALVPTAWEHAAKEKLDEQTRGAVGPEAGDL